MIKEYGKKYPLLFGICAFLVLYLAIKLLQFDTDLAEALKRIVCSVLMILVLWPVMGSSYLKFPGPGWKSSLLLSRGLLLSAAAIFLTSSLLPLILELLSAHSLLPVEAETRGPIPEGLPGRVLLHVFYYFSVGLAEELAFRLGLFACSDQQFSKTKNRAFETALITSLFFGFVHVVSALSADPMAILTSVLKTIETGMMGFIMCAAVYSSHNLWPAVLIHAFGDFMPTFDTAIWQDTEEITYVMNSSDMGEAAHTCFLYIVMILIYLPGVIRSVKVLRAEQKADGAQ